MQLIKLKKILNHAYSNVSFYHRKFVGAGIKPDDIKTLHDLVKIPVTTKSEIRDTPIEEVMPRNFNIGRAKKNTTSGSTGIPLTTYMDERAFKFYSAVWLAVLLESGLRLRDKRAIIEDPRNFPPRRSWHEYFALLRERHISIFENVEKQLKVLREFNPQIIEGYPSSLKILADASRKQNWPLTPRLLFTLGETLDKADRNMITSVFNADLLDFYGSSEFSLVAFECFEHSGYHVNADCLITELLRDGEQVSFGERGEITCTSLVNYATPLIRYLHGDIGVLSEEQCSCGKKLPLLKKIEGREDDFLLATNGRIISPEIFFPYPFQNFEGIRQFKVVQEENDRLRIQLVIDGISVPKTVLSNAEKEIHRVFGGSMKVDFEFVSEIARDPSGKIKKIVSKIPVRFGSD
jgi:phenylacetate-CoA ligase